MHEQAKIKPLSLHDVTQYPNQQGYLQAVAMNLMGNARRSYVSGHSAEATADIVAPGMSMDDTKIALDNIIRVYVSEQYCVTVSAVDGDDEARRVSLAVTT